MEPTDNTVQGGCLGNLNARWTFSRRGRALARGRGWPTTRSSGRRRGSPRSTRTRRGRVAFDGLEFVEVASVTKIAGGVAGNVVPDTVECGLNFRYAPGRTPAEAEARLAELCARARRAARSSANAPRGAVHVAHPEVQRLIAVGGLDVAPKQAWTPGGGARPPPASPPSTSARATRRRPTAATSTCRIDALVRCLRGPGGLAVRLSPGAATGLPPYPFARLRGDRATRWRARGVEILDFGMGEPREETPALHPRRAGRRDRARSRPTPPTAGLPELRAAIAAWVGRRFGVALDPDSEVDPDARAPRRSIFSLAQRGRGRGRGPVARATRCPSAARCSPAGRWSSSRCAPTTASCPTSTRMPDWDRVGLLWLNYPNNPTAAVAPLVAVRAGRRAGARARRPRLLRRGLHARSTSATSRRRRSCRSPTSPTCSRSTRCPSARRCRATASGFAAGDPQAIAALKRYRPNTGTVPQDFVQRASVAAWDDEAHVEAMRAIYRAKRDVLLPACEAAGLRPRRRRRDDVPVARATRTGLARAAARARRRPRAGRLLRRGRPRLRAAGARRRRSRRLRAAPPQSLPAWRAALRPPQSPVRGTASRRAGHRVAPEQQVGRAGQLARP